MGLFSGSFGQKGWIVLGVVSLGVMGYVGAQISLPDPIQNLTQTLRTSIIMDSSEQPRLTLGTGSDLQNAIRWPLGALADQSIVYEDLDPAIFGSDTYECPEGQALTAITATGPTCQPLPLASYRQSTNSGTESIYFEGQNNTDDYPKVCVGYDASGCLPSNPSGIYGKNGFQATDRLAIAKKSLQLVAPSTEKPAMLHHTQDLVIGQPVNKPAYGYGKRASVTVGTDDVRSEQVHVGGDARIGTSLWVANPTSTSFLSLASSDSESFGIVRRGSDAGVLQLDSSHVLVGGSRDADLLRTTAGEQLSIGGDMLVREQKGSAPVDLGGFGRPETTTVGTLNPESTVPDECVALSLDKDGQVVLVNICAD